MTGKSNNFKNLAQRNLNLSQCQVFFDFDNTIVPFDVLDDIIKRFSENTNWVGLEKEWGDGKIGSKECLKGQMRLIKISKDSLVRYLFQIRLDPYFNKLLTLLKEKGIEPIILSDSFSFIINRILRNNGIKNVKVYSNRIKFHGDRLMPSFPHTDKTCSSCAHCKKNNLLNNSINDKIIIYIGDGRSDICAAQEADLVFAKGGLLEHFKKIKRECVEIKDLRDVYSYFKEAFQ